MFFSNVTRPKTLANDTPFTGFLAPPQEKKSAAGDGNAMASSIVNPRKLGEES